MAADDNHVHDHEHSSSSSHHFLVVAYGIQSHVNPGRVLAQRLVHLGGGVPNNNGGSILATLSVPVATYRRMFPSLAGAAGAETTTTDDGVISYVPYSNGFDDGSTPKSPEEWDRSCHATSRSLSALLARFATGSRPVTCVVCTLMVPGVLDVAREHDVPLAVYWIQPATVLATYYHYFHGYGELIAAASAMDATYEVSLPGLGRRCRPLRVRDLPSFLVNSQTDDAETTHKFLQELYEYMDQWRPRVLVNTSYELEVAALTEMNQHLDIFPIGPVVRTSSAVKDPPARIHLFKHDDIDKKRYMDWLGAHRDKTVVYVSSGSITKCSKLQMEEVVRGLRRCGRPYLLVVRKDGLEEEDDDGGLQEITTQDDEMGMVVDWCEQLEVLSHTAVGCFVTHCGWNSTLEAMVSGVPIVGVPKTFDQPTNMYLMEVEWTIGVRGECDNEGVLTGTELARCIEMVMGDSTQAMAMRERACAMKEMAREIADTGGPAERNLRDFVKTFQAHT